MKKLNTALTLLLVAGTLSTASAQVKDEVKEDARKVGHEVKKGAQKTGNKTAELASKAKSKVVDKEYRDKIGPKGETIYIDKHSKYYWVDKKGHHRYIKESALRSR